MRTKLSPFDGIVLSAMKYLGFPVSSREVCRIVYIGRDHAKLLLKVSRSLLKLSKAGLLVRTIEKDTLVKHHDWQRVTHTPIKVAKYVLADLIASIEKGGK